MNTCWTHFEWQTAKSPANRVFAALLLFKSGRSISHISFLSHLLWAGKAGWNRWSRFRDFKRSADNPIWICVATNLLIHIMPTLNKLSVSFKKQEIDIVSEQPLIQSAISQLEHFAQADGPCMQLFSYAFTENILDLRNHFTWVVKHRQTHLNVRCELSKAVA